MSTEDGEITSGGKMELMGNIDNSHPHAAKVQDWVRSIVGPLPSPVEQDWVDDTSAKRCNDGHQSNDDVETFYNVAVGLFLDLDVVRVHPTLAKLVANTNPRHLWAIFCGPSAWQWTAFDWTLQWEDVLRQCAKTFNGHPLSALPIRIPVLLNHLGEYVVDCDIPNRWSVQAAQGRLDGHDTELTRLRVWNLVPDRCLLANSAWEGVTITNSTFVRCTFRNTSFRNVQFLDCTFTDVDFHDVTIRDSWVSSTILSGTTFHACTFSGVSWVHNNFQETHFDGVNSSGSNWTYISYFGMVVSFYTEKRNTEHWVQMINGLPC